MKAIKHLKDGQTNTPVWNKNFGVSDSLQPENVCNTCCRVYLSKAKLTSHIKSHDRKLSKICFTKVIRYTRALLMEKISHSCHICNWSCKNIVGLRTHSFPKVFLVNGGDSKDCKEVHLQKFSSDNSFFYSENFLWLNIFLVFLHLSKWRNW